MYFAPNLVSMVMVFLVHPKVFHIRINQVVKITEKSLLSSRDAVKNWGQTKSLSNPSECCSPVAFPWIRIHCSTRLVKALCSCYSPTRSATYFSSAVYPRKWQSCKAHLYQTASASTERWVAEVDDMAKYNIIFTTHDAYYIG